jgi:hypothetical protein
MSDVELSAVQEDCMLEEALDQWRDKHRGEIE